MKIGNKHVYFIGLFILLCFQVKGQSQYAVVLGGGYSTLERPFYNGGSWEMLKGMALIESGASIYGNFGDERKIGWQVGLMIQSSGFQSIPIDMDKVNEDRPPGSSLVINPAEAPRDYKNVYRKRNWGFTAPVSFTYSVFEPIVLFLGPEFQYSLTSFPEKDKWKINNRGYLDPRFKNFNIMGHLGLFTDVGPKIRIAGKVFSDIISRLNYHHIEGDQIEKGYRQMGFSLQVSYKIN